MQTSDQKSSRASAQESGFNLKAFLPYRLSVLANTVSQGIAASYLERFGISVTEWRVIAVLGGSPGVTASDVMTRTAMEKVPVSRAVKALVEKSLLQRKTDNQDRRCRRLQLTPQGQAVFNDIIPRAQAYETALLEALSKKEIESLNALLDTLKKRATTLSAT